MKNQINRKIEFDHEHLGIDLRIWMRTNKKTLSDVTKETGIKESTLSRIRNGKDNVLFTEVVYLAYLMGYSLNKYVEVKEDKNGNV